MRLVIALVLFLAASAQAEVLYSPYPPAETAQRIAQVFARYGLEARRGDAQVPVTAGDRRTVLQITVESPARVVDDSRCRWSDAYGRPIDLRIRADANGVTWVEYALPPKRVNAFGVIECGKTHDDLERAMKGLMEMALEPSP